LRQAQIQAVWDQAQNDTKTGRVAAARKTLYRIPLSELQPRMANDVGALKTKLETADRQTKECRAFITIPCDRLAGPLARTLGEALDAVTTALGPDTIDRFDAFVTLAKQHEAEVAAGKKPTQTIEDVLALAVTGFVLGNSAADPKVATAER